MKVLQVLNVVALTDDLPGRGLCRGQVGTIVEALAPGVFEVEFSDNNGRRCDILAGADHVVIVLGKPYTGLTVRPVRTGSVKSLVAFATW